MQVSFSPPIRILFFVLLGSFSPTCAGISLFSPQTRGELKRAVDSCLALFPKSREFVINPPAKSFCSQTAVTTIKNPVTRQLVQDFGKMMSPILSGAGKAFGLGVTAHGFVVSGALISALYWAEGQEESRPDRRPAVLNHESSAVLGAVLTMYGQGCVLEESFSPDVTFEDPAGKCKGFAEVKEAFRALKAMSPQTLKWEMGEVTPEKIEIRMMQRYLILSRDVDLYSKVVVRHDKGRITSMEDRWKGKPLLHFPPFTWCRRLNGKISDFLTPRLVTDSDDEE